MLENTVVVALGSTFVVSGHDGDILAEKFQGFFKADTRFLSGCILKIDGRRLQTLSSGTLGVGVASFYLANARTRRLRPHRLTVIRDRQVGETGFHDDLTIANQSQRALQISVELDFAADFADVFEIRLGKPRKAGVVTLESIENRVALTYRYGQYVRQTVIAVDPPAEIAGQCVHWTVELAPKSEWRACLDVMPLEHLGETIRPLDCGRSRLAQGYSPQSPELVDQPAIGGATTRPDWWPAPRLISTDHALTGAYHQAIADLTSLEMDGGEGRKILAAGLPWFMAIFGRDSILSSYQTLLLGPSLARDTLSILAGYQALEVNDFRDAQPGKIPHEIRRGELSALDRMPHSRYYGTIDATPLFLILLGEVYRWTGDLEFVRGLLPAARRALAWIDDYGDLDGDGFVEYERRTPHGLLNQGWKDSDDSIVFADGRRATGPCALAEVQGYVYDAKIRMAEVFDAIGEPDEAAALRRAAAALREQFEAAFWLPNEGYYALALDGRNRPVDSITSNVGHCLWSGIIAPERAARVAERLLAPDLFSGWGIRTMSTEAWAYNPISYHNGSVWPHDTSIVAAGLARYGFHREAGTVLRGLLDAASCLPRHRLPEVFAGFPRRLHGFPPAYPTANAPQAWAAGSVILALRLLLGVESAGDRLVTRSIKGAPVIHLEGVPYRGQRLTLANDK